MKDLTIYQDEKQAVCASRENTSVVKFITWGSFTEEIQNALVEGNIWGVYFDENGNIVAEDRDGEVYENILQ